MNNQTFIFVMSWAFFAASSVYLDAYVFDKTSCDNMLPKMAKEMDTSTEVTTTTTTTTARERRIKRPSVVINPQQTVDLTEATGLSPYKVTVDVTKYRRSRTHIVRIDASSSEEFDGFMLQARQYLRPQSSPALMGTFVDLPSEIRTLDCDRGPSFSVANTAVIDGENLKSRNSIQLKWRAPANDVGSIQFVATIIKGTTYWHFVNSTPLIINDFPPALDGCGKDRSCFRYSEVHDNCNDGQCNYLVVSKVVSDYVSFTIGGRIHGDTGYVALGFTPDKEKLSLVDVCACMKKGPEKVDAAHYMITKQHGPLEKHHEELEDEETDNDGDQIWCRFRRPLRIPGGQTVDLADNLFQLFLWGKLDSSSEKPVMPKDEDIVRAVETWNHTQTLNVVHLVGGSDIARISWTILFAVLVATLFELY